MGRKSSGKRRTKGVTGGTLSEPSPAAEVIASNVDLLTEILLRLPAKSLVRFKCVSKHWLSLISDSRFASSHARRRRISISALYWNFEQLSLDGGDHHSHATLSFVDGACGERVMKWITHSCNGLMLWGCCHFDPSGISTMHYIVCNPTTQKYRRIPDHDQPDGQSSIPTRPRACLAFDPSKSPHYKVVLLYLNRIDIYTSESGSWKQIGAPGSRIRGLGPPVFWDGAIHWFSDDGVSLIRFEVDAEEMIAMRNPPSPKILPPHKTRYFGECGGRLVLIQARSPLAMRFKILEMDMDYSRWIVKYRVNLRPMIFELLEMESKIRGFDRFFVLCVVKKGEKGKDFELMLAMLGRVFSYDVKCKTWKLLPDRARGKSTSCRGPDAYPYIASLSPV